MNVTSEKVLTLWADKARARGANPEALIEAQAQALAGTAEAVAAALNGSEADRLDLEALFKLRRFSAQAQAFTETNAWLGGLLDAVAEITSTLLVAGGKLAGQALVAALKGALNSEGK